MISIDLKKYKTLDQALKAYKQKHNKIGIVKELRERQEFVKPSVKKRAQNLKAQYVQKKFGPKD
jgi:small subunit ribosomal protein S21